MLRQLCRTRRAGTNAIPEEKFTLVQVRNNPLALTGARFSSPRSPRIPAGHVRTHGISPSGRATPCRPRLPRQQQSSGDPLAARAFRDYHGCMGGSARRCDYCRRTLPVKMHSHARFCSASCRARRWRELEATKRRAAAHHNAESRWRSCPVCGAQWIAGLHLRSDARFCSPRCRTRAWRLNNQNVWARQRA